jgi:hypothetical protein
MMNTNMKHEDEKAEGEDDSVAHTLVSFAWRFIERPTGSAAELSDPTLPDPTFGVDLPGDYTLELSVRRGMVLGSPDTVTISTYNGPPVADAGTDQTAYLGQPVMLDGSNSSDVDGDPLGYLWQLISAPAGSTSQLENVSSLHPSLTVDLPGAYVIELVVSDAQSSGDPDRVKVTTINSPPVADAGPDQTVFVNDQVMLDASGSSDVDGDLLSYHWTLDVLPEGSSAQLSYPDTLTPSFSVDQSGSYQAQLIVNDGTIDSTPDTVTITTANSPPVAHAGEDLTLYSGDSALLDGAASTDVDGDELSYFWALLSIPTGSYAEIANPHAAITGFTVDFPGSYVA